jgi:hypothetical protein
MSFCTFRTGGHAILDVGTNLSGMSVVVLPRFVVQFWAPIIEKCGKVGGEDDDE